MAEPACFLQAHEGPAYDIKFYGHGEGAVLLRFNYTLILFCSAFLSYFLISPYLH